MKVLVVAQTVVADGLAYDLKAKGWEVTKAYTPEAAMKAAHGEEFDVAVVIVCRHAPNLGDHLGPQLPRELPKVALDCCRKPRWDGWTATTRLHLSLKNILSVVEKAAKGQPEKEA